MKKLLSFLNEEKIVKYKVTYTRNNSELQGKLQTEIISGETTLENFSDLKKKMDKYIYPEYSSKWEKTIINKENN